MSKNIDEKRTYQSKKTNSSTNRNSKYKKFDLKNVHITYRQENYEHCGKEGFVKVLECSKCKKQYRKYFDYLFGKNRYK